MEEALNRQPGSVEPFPETPKNTLVSDELNRILSLLRDACPADAHISFDFDGTLHAHIDVRKREEVTAVEILLPMLGHGLFHDITRGGTPHHPFFHRISVLVDR